MAEARLLVQCACFGLCKVKYSLCRGGGVLYIYINLIFVYIYVDKGWPIKPINSALL